jgi:ParB/RepB/Spo0J family partition protein
MARQARNKIRPPKPQLKASANILPKEVDYPEARAMNSGVVAAVAKGDVRKTLADGIAGGIIPVGINADQIDAKHVESDRQSGWDTDEDFQLLMQNIRDRGQIQPVVVRPVEKDWRPSENTPMAVRESDRFILLSGRRRHLACVKLGVPVRAIIRVKEDELDIEERFFENTVRRGLTQLEFHISVGQIADARDWSQTEVAKRLGVTQSRVSKALKIFRHLSALLDAYPDANSLSRDDLYAAVDHVSGAGSQDAAPLEDDETAEASDQEASSSPSPRADVQKQKIERPNCKGQFVRKNGRSQLKLSLSLPDDATEDQVSEIADKIAAIIN